MNPQQNTIVPGNHWADLALCIKQFCKTVYMPQSEKLPTPYALLRGVYIQSLHKKIFECRVNASLIACQPLECSSWES